MDELNAFFNKPGGSKPIKLRGPLTCGMRLTKENTMNIMDRKEEHRTSIMLHGTDYARGAKEREIETYLKNETEREKWESLSGGLNSLEHLSTLGYSMPNIGELPEQVMTEVYNKYSFKREIDNHFEINEYKQQIIGHIQGQPVVIIEGPTGCGKTTQVPQWILDDCYERRRHCKIIVTQPRRIAAISIAKRVAQERGWDVGGLVGYQVGLENKTSTDTRISYVTTGVLLQKLVNAKTMNEYTHIFLDEVHERNQEMDFLLLVVKKLLYTASPGVKVILMSATFNIKSFADYFLIPTSIGLEPCSSIRVVKKKPMFTVKTFYLNHLHQFGSLLQNQTFNYDEPAISLDMYNLVIKLLNAFEQIDKKEDHYDNPEDADLPSVLIFLPGINEIEELYGYLNNLQHRAKVSGPECAQYHWWVLPLHSTITADEQVRVFQRAPTGHRKVILSTNIAESSITVPDIKYVIDFCLMKVLVADDNTNFTSLQLMWASKTNCEQRAGRAGRVRDGRVYRLVNEKFYDDFKQECEPEIQRCPLERLVLLAKMLEMGPPADILALAMDPPDLSNIYRTILVLKEIGALKKTLDDEDSLIDGDITYLGRICAKLPLDVRVSKLIMLGYIFGCLDETVIMGAAMSVKNMFSSPFQERLNAYNSKLTWADGSTSDCIAFLNVYKVWNHLRRQQYFKQPGNNEFQWARRFFVQVRALRELDDMVRELGRRLAREGLEAPRGRSPWAKNELTFVLKILIAGAFYPFYFVQSKSDEGREREAVKILSGHNPATTVYLKDFPTDQPGQLYASSIKKLVKKLTGDEPRVSFDTNSSKVFLSFTETAMNSQTTKMDNSGNPIIPGKVVLSVYKAIKAKQLKMDIRVALLPQDKANELVAAMEMEKLNINPNQMIPRLPDIDDTHIPIKISQFTNCGNFWVQYDDECTAGELRGVQAALAARPLLALRDACVGRLCAAPYRDAACRARVLRRLPQDVVWVLYVDYGTFGRVNAGSLRELPAGACRELPPLAVRCVLAELAPSALLDAHAQWTPAATGYFQELTRRGNLHGKVYSVCDGVVSIELLAEGGKVNVNKELVQKGYAQPSEESYESKLNHDLRVTATELNLAQKRAHNKHQAELAYKSQELIDFTSPSPSDCVTSVVLKGPFSPLESNVYTMLYGSRNKQVTIEWNSVNSVLLDTEPQELYERLLVAGVVGQSQTGGKLTLRHTTLMPYIPGLPAIMAMLFCPVMELRRDEKMMRYVSALCGLGAAADGRPLFPDHDMLVAVDVDVTIDDLGLINHVRHLMDYMMFCADGQDAPAPDDELRPKVPALIREDLVKLLWRRRKHRESYAVPHAWDWGSTPEDDLLEITDANILDWTVIYPLHTPLELRPRSQDELYALKKANDELKITVSRTPASSGGGRAVACALCGSPALGLQAMRIHLYSRAHRDKEDDLRIFDA